MKHSAGVAAAAVALGIKPVISSAAESEKRVCEWYENIYRQFHIDYAFGTYKEIFRNFDSEATAQMVEEAGIHMGR